MYKEKLDLIDVIINDLDTTTLIALYEVVVNEDFDYIENLFPTKEDFKEFIKKFSERENNV